MLPEWIVPLKKAVTAIGGLKRYWKATCGFVLRVSTLSERREAQQIENMSKFLDAFAKQLEVLKKAGCAPEVLQNLALTLGVPAIQANLEAMLVARNYVPATSARHFAADAASARKDPPAENKSSPSDGDKKPGEPAPSTGKASTRSKRKDATAPPNPPPAGPGDGPP